MEEKGFGLCSQHGTHCKAIEYLENSQNEIQRDIKKNVVDLKDARGSMKHDFQRFEDAIRKDYVTRAEFEPFKKLAYGLTALLIAYGVKMVVI